MKLRLFILAGAPLVLAGAHCTDQVVHVFGGYAYDPAQDCLEAPGALDVLEGPAPAPCPTVRCWLAPDGTAVVTDEACDAPPDYEDETSASSGLCPKALAAYGRAGHGQCPASPDGGTGGAA